MQTPIRDAIIGYLHPLYVAQYPSVPIVFDNGPFDWANPPPVFAEVSVEFFSGAQSNLAATPLRRVSGYVYCTVRVRAGTGVRDVLSMLDWFSETLKFKRLPEVNLEAPQPEPPDEPRGWYMQTVKIGFTSNPA